jgi:hypothetical protein
VNSHCWKESNRLLFLFYHDVEWKHINTSRKLEYNHVTIEISKKFISHQDSVTEHFQGLIQSITVFPPPRVMSPENCPVNRNHRPQGPRHYNNSNKLPDLLAMLICLIVYLCNIRVARRHICTMYHRVWRRSIRKPCCYGHCVVIWIRWELNLQQSVVNMLPILGCVEEYIR